MNAWKTHIFSKGFPFILVPPLVFLYIPKHTTLVDPPSEPTAEEVRLERIAEMLKFWSPRDFGAGEGGSWRGGNSCSLKKKHVVLEP